MRVVLNQNVMIDGEVRASGFVVDRDDDDFCEQLVARGLAVRDASPIAPAVIEGFYESEGAFVDAIDDVIEALPVAPVVEAAPVVTPRRNRHR